jgi:hypothetical protein
VTIQPAHVSARVPARPSTSVPPDADRVPLPAFASVRLGLVLWGGLALLDLGRMAHAPSYLDLTLVALLVATACVRMRAGTALAATVVGWLLVDGFVTHRYGSLGYDGTPDLARFALLAVVATIATIATRVDR